MGYTGAMAEPHCPLRAPEKSPAQFPPNLAPGALLSQHKNLYTALED